MPRATGSIRWEALHTGTSTSNAGAASLTYTFQMPPCSGLPGVRCRLAEDIIASQVIEIEGMKRRLAVLRGEAQANEDEFPALGGTRGPVE